MINAIELGKFMKNATLIINGTPERQAELVMKATAFDALLNEDADTLIKMVVNVADLTEDTEQKAELYSFALETAKEQGEFFLEVCYNVAARINKLEDELQVQEIYELLSDQKEFKKIMSAAGIGYKKTKRGRPVKRDPLEDAYNEWQYPDSSSIHKYMYNPDTLNLYVQFTSGEKLYTYVNVPRFKFADFHNA
ncbi:MAG: KTSC domain-containing protein, partial [Candidatus Pacebacteria bacterium]|nr:KTSC domain-containing protein [Fermentimonas sp.]MDD4804399.1 KTSC domain-containing protein [Candidatus Paceibacterota bacterium]